MGDKMKKFHLFLIGIGVLLLILFIFVGLALQARLFTNNLEDLENVDQIRLIVLLGINKSGVPDEIRPVKTINDPEQIAQIVAKMRIYSDNWQYEEFTPPWTGIAGRIAPVRIIFYNQGKVKTFLSIGYSKDISYFLQQSPGPGRYLEYQEFKELMDFLGLKEEFAYHER
jgi:hypothetical protein